MRVIRILIALAIALIGGSATGVAQSQRAQGGATESAQPENCGSCKHNLSTNEHWFNGQCTAGATECYDCVAFNSCHSNPQTPYSCQQYHWACGGAAVARAVVERAVSGFVPIIAVAQAAKASPKHVQLLKSGYVVIRGCKNEVLAAYRIETSLGQALAAGAAMPVAEAQLPVLRSWRRGA